jgi:hypothetical protein
VMQDAVLDAVHAAIATLVSASRSSCAAAGRRRTAAAGATPLQLRGDHPRRPRARRRPEELPADLREFYEARWYAAGADAPHPRARRRGGAGRHRPAVRGTTSPASWSTPRSARTCGCRAAVVHRRARRCDRAPEPLRQPDHGRPGR